MSGESRLPGVAGVRLALPLSPGGARSPLRRRAALGLAVVLAAVLATLVATGTAGVTRGEAATVPLASGPAAAEAEVAQGPAQLRAAPPAPQARSASSRVVAPTHAAALFAQHSWYVIPPAPAPAPPPPPPEPTAPPLPYAFLGSYAPQGEKPVFFLARGDRVIDAHVGDRLDGVYQFESAAGGQLVFVYLPLNVRQNLPAGASK